MKAKKWLTIITLVVSVIALIAAILIGKASNSISYDISMALLGSAVLGFIMSITEYFVEKRKAMEEFWSQANRVLKELRKIKYLDEDAPLNLIIDAFREEQSNKWNRILSTISEENEVRDKAKNNLLSWFEENYPLHFDENTDVEKELDSLYRSKMEQYKKSFIQSMDSYLIASTVELGALDNAYGNLDFMFSNNYIRQKAYDSIYDKMRNIVFQYRSEAYHFNMLKEGKGNFSVCASKVVSLNNEYFNPKEDINHGYTNTLVFQNIFDDIDSALEEFRCKIYRAKYTVPKREPISGKMIYFGDDTEIDK